MNAGCVILIFTIPAVLYVVLRRRFPAPAQRGKCVLRTIFFCWALLYFSRPLAHKLSLHYLCPRISGMEGYNFDVPGNQMMVEEGGYLSILGWIPAVMSLAVVAAVRALGDGAADHLEADAKCEEPPEDQKGS